MRTKPTGLKYGFRPDGSHWSQETPATIKADRAAEERRRAYKAAYDAKNRKPSAAAAKAAKQAQVAAIRDKGLCISCLGPLPHDAGNRKLVRCLGCRKLFGRGRR